MTTTTGRPASARLATTTASRPPVASSPIALGATARNRSTSAAMPSVSRGTSKRSSGPRTCTSRRSLENVDTDDGGDGVHLSPVLAQAGFRWRPKRLFGFNGTASVGPCSPTGLVSLRGVGPHARHRHRHYTSVGAMRVTRGAARRFPVKRARPASTSLTPQPLSTKGEGRVGCITRTTDCFSEAIDGGEQPCAVDVGCARHEARACVNPHPRLTFPSWEGL